MIKKYNFALIPVTKNEEVVKLSQRFDPIADKYILCEYSLPHVTLCQFDAEESDIDSIWKNICQIWREESIDLEFKTFSCLTFNNNIYWVSLLPNKIDVLYEMHVKIAKIINLPVKLSFDPHMTLISSKNKEYENEVDKVSAEYRPIRDIFILTLGKRDDIGQLTEVIYKCE